LKPYRKFSQQQEQMAANRAIGLDWTWVIAQRSKKRPASRRNYLPAEDKP
jgi:hypothetical protein